MKKIIDFKLQQQECNVRQKISISNLRKIRKIGKKQNDCYKLNKFIMQNSQQNYQERAYSVGVDLSKRTVDKQVKNNLLHVQMLKNRLKVLSSQAQYTRIKSKYQNEKIFSYYKIRQQAAKNKNQINQKLKSRFDISLKRQNCNKLKEKIQEGLLQALQKLKEDKIQNSKQIKKLTEKNMDLLAKRKAKQLQQNKLQKQEVSKMEKNVKEVLYRYSEDKKEDIKLMKQLQKKNLLNLSEQMAKNVQYLSQKQKQLIDINSQSMSASRQIDLQYRKLYSSKIKEHLPYIKRKYPSTSSQLQ